MNNNIYQENILFHYKNPKNTEKLDEHTHASKIANYTCGDEIELELKIEDGIVTEIGHQTNGCAISIAGASILSEYIKGKTLKEIQKMGKEELLDLLGIELSPSRLKCALLGFEALKEAIK